jgi:hypothetical protein
MLEYLQRLAWDPTAPVPGGWPHGWYGVLLLFCIPGGAGIPPGVLLGHRDGIGALPMTILYFLSDVVLAMAFEPMLRILALVGRWVPFVERIGRAVMLLIERMMPTGGLVGPTSVMLTAFGAGLPFGRALAAGAGYGLVTGWLLTIAGDMVYYLIGMVSTLWFDGMLGDQRMAAFAGLGVMLIVPMIVRRLRTTVA